LAAKSPAAKAGVAIVLQPGLNLYSSCSFILSTFAQKKKNKKSGTQDIQNDVISSQIKCRNILAYTL